ncbi:hypothetical protein GCM10018980_51250 [Streptomyces capoamus]|uniref:Uncharacterized protein n=1 Tax=Streptomyces capoamus TaxID=68183 RepID=A0A919EZE9_9ACTN|nr:hypothetical protein [Streptomyces capoamus]GGW15848.1 hypothetical protein GCM10010501_29560 [Streptomyces libani subsp. rufus]GHG61804.1 hypothetical protein GCM10018980_51250 [Streptomyces capoamus]
MRWPFVRTADYEKAVGTSEYALDQLAATRIVNDCLTDANLAVARRLTRALRACARYRKALAAEQRRADQLQRRLDNAVGLNITAVAHGETWQERREQKMRYDK